MQMMLGEAVDLEVETAVSGLDPRFAGCVMCAIAEGVHDPQLRVRSTADGVVVLDRFAATRGHLLVIASNHVEHLADLDWEAYQRLQRLAWEAARALRQVLAPRRVYVAALGAPRQLSKSYPHLHLHVVPIYEDGEEARPANVFSWRRGVWTYPPHEARELVDALGSAWEPVSV